MRIEIQDPHNLVNAVSLNQPRTNYFRNNIAFLSVKATDVGMTFRFLEPFYNYDNVEEMSLTFVLTDRNGRHAYIAVINTTVRERDLLQGVNAHNVRSGKSIEHSAIILCDWYQHRMNLEQTCIYSARRT